ncbi:MAG: helix-turn-helix transcriptional regulator [Acidobacteria bacterium]|nr:helix-turn-helix transcriptional regulator [Acidobacteriota bacterium]
MLVSERLRVAIKTSPERQYRLAHQIEVHPSVLSHWLNGITDPRVGDPRIIALGQLVGVPAAECFNTPSK